MAKYALIFFAITSMPLEPFGVHREYAVVVTDQEPHTLYRVMRKSGQLQNCIVQPALPPETHIPNPQIEAQGLAKMDANAASALFENNRRKVMGALRAIAGYVFRQLDLPRSGGADFGCGATGAMVHDFLRDEINATGWAEIDVHPDAVRVNKDRHPHATVINGSYHDTSALGLHNTLQIATGLSSLDATFFTDHAIEQITSSLVPGGYFLHIQDVRPGVNVVFKSLEEMNIKAPYKAELAPSSKNDSNIVLYETPEGPLSVIELFRRRIGRAISRNPNLELKANSWVIAKRPVKKDEPGRIYQANICLDIPDRTLFPQIPRDLVKLMEPHADFEQAAAVVTVAKKVA